MYVIASASFVKDATKEGYMFGSTSVTTVHMPRFTIATAAYLQYTNGVVAIPSVRKTKIKAVDDLIAAVEYLLDKKYIANKYVSTSCYSFTLTLSD